MRLLRRRRATAGQRLDMVDELERMLKRGVVIPVVLLPILLFTGLGLGKATTRGIALPADAPVRIAAAAHTPREHLEALSAHMSALRSHGRETEEYVRLYQNHVRPVEESLKGRGLDPELSRRVAWPLVEHSYERGLDPATVVAVLLVESNGRPHVTSFMGARGLMQIMPLHQGRWHGCGDDMFDITNNICYGTSILAWLLGRFGGDERRALLAYNGCVRGTNTPNCHTYPSKVKRIREQIQRDWERLDPDAYDPVYLGSSQRAE
jgi:soluble lytic murein transglycosylase-like protein